MKQYDLVIIGSGVGLSILEVALHHGLNCAIIEKDSLGGTCLNRGCIPSKVLVYPADLVREAGHARKIGVSFSDPEIDWPKISRRMWSYISHNESIENSLSAADQVDLYRGTAQFTGPDTIWVPDEKHGRTELFKGTRFVIAAGVRTFVPPISGLESAGYVTSETFFGSQFPKSPWKKLAIIGGGAIGLEFAHIFSAFGTEVTMIEKASHLAPLEEPAVSSLLETEFRHQGIRVMTQCTASAASLTDTGKRLMVKHEVSGEEQAVDCDEIFVAAGVRSNADLLHVEKSGVQTDQRGYIITNTYLETNLPNVFALGDINGKFQFRHKANYEAEILVNNLFHSEREKKEVDYRSVPWAVFTSPQIAHVGLREDEVRAKGIPYKVAYNDYASIAKGYAMGYEEDDPDNGFTKLIVDENMKILGVHIVGPQAAILLQPFVYLMNAGLRCTQKTLKQITARQKRIRSIAGIFPPCSEAGTLEPIAQSMVIHPSLSELTAWAIEGLEWAE